MDSDEPRKPPRNLHSVVREENAATAARARAITAKPTNADRPEETVDQRVSKINRGCLGIFTGYEGCFYSRSSIPLAFNPQRPLSPPPTRRATRASMLQLKKLDVPPEYFLDRCYRDFILGRIVLEAIDPYYDYDIIDLRGRDKIDGTPETLASDEFLFKVHPLALRTWYFQSAFEAENSVDSLAKLWHDGQKSLRSIDEIRMEVLQQHLSDDWLWLTYSPALPSFCAVVIGCFTADSACFYVLCALMVVCVQVAKKCNMASRLHRERWLTLLPRLGAVAWILALGMSPATINGKISTTSALPCVVRILAAVVLILDVFLGDVFGRLRARLRGTQFVIRQSLSKKLYICEHTVTSHQCVGLSESVIGPTLFAEQAEVRRFSLVADLDGILCELRPLTFKDLPSPAETKVALKMYSISVF